MDFYCCSFVKKFKVCTHNNRHKWVSKGRESPFGTRFCGTQSLVCYTFVPTALKRMSVAIHDSRLFIGEEQTDKLRSETEKICFSDCSEKEQTVYITPAAAERKFYFFFAARRKNGMSALCKSSFISCVAPPRFPIVAMTESTIFSAVIIL